MNTTKKTQAQLKALQTKAETLAQTMDKEVLVATQGKQHINVKPGKAYEISVKEGEVLNKDFDTIAQKVGNDLEVLLPNDAVVVFDNYFEVCASDLSCVVSLPAEGGVYYVVEGNFVTLADGTQIVHFYGDEATLTTMASSSSSYSSSTIAELLPMFEQGVSFAGVGGALAAVDIAGAGASASAASTIALVITGSIVLGPVVTGNGLTVEAFQADGTTPVPGTASTTVNTDGSFTVDLGSYTSVVILKVIDTNAAADYVDEATGAQVDLDTTLLAAVDASSGGAITVAVTPVTTLAAQQAGITESGGVPSGTTLDASTVNTANKGVATAFGLTDIINDIPQAVIAQDGTSDSSADAYGKVLAALSGMDKATGGVGETINTLKDSLTGTGENLALDTSAKTAILDGAQQAEIDNDNINTLTTDSAIKTVTTGASATTAIKLGFQDTGSSSSEGITKAYDLDGAGSGTAMGIKINVSGVTANDWVYSVDSGTTWALGGSNTSFDLPAQVAAYNKSNIMVRTGTSTTTGTTGAEVALASSDTVTVDETAPTMTLSGSGAAGYLAVTIGQVDGWEYSLDNGVTWATGVNDKIYLEAGQSWGAGVIQIKGKDAAGNESSVVSNTSTVTTSDITLSLVSDTGSSSADGKTNDATVNVSVSGSGAWEYRTTNSGAWLSGTGTSFELPSGSTAVNGVEVKVAGAADGTAVNLGSFISAGNVEVSTSAPSALTISLDSDTGSANNDFITNSKQVNISGVTGSNTWEYSTDGGINWKTGTGTSFNLLDNRSYVANQIQVRQTDVFGNTNTNDKDNPNAATDIAKITSEVKIDTVAPTITAFSATTADGTYGVGSNIAITATTSEKVVSGSTITVTLDTGDTVVLTASADGTTLTGTYTIGSSDTSSDLTVSSFTIGSTTKDLAGSAMTDTTVPSGKNISDTSAIVVDGDSSQIQSLTIDADNQQAGDGLRVGDTEIDLSSSETIEFDFASQSWQAVVDSATGSVVFSTQSGQAVSDAEIESLLESLKFYTNSPSTTERNVEIYVTDADGNSSNSATVGLTVSSASTEVGGFSASSDTISLAGLGFSEADGLAGTDVLSFTVAGDVTLDETNSQQDVMNIERLDFDNALENNISLSDLFATDSNSVDGMKIDLDSLDTLSLSASTGNWTANESDNIVGYNAYKYTNGVDNNNDYTVYVTAGHEVLGV